MDRMRAVDFVTLVSVDGCAACRYVFMQDDDKRRKKDPCADEIDGLARVS